MHETLIFLLYFASIIESLVQIQFSLGTFSRSGEYVVWLTAATVEDHAFSHYSIKDN